MNATRSITANAVNIERGKIYKRIEGIVATWLMKKGENDSNVKRGNSCIRDRIVAFAKKMRYKRKPSTLGTRQRQAPVLCASTRTKGKNTKEGIRGLLNVND